eukprot:SAG11_NODE_767_length_7273_cov_3.106914_11_plen_338_part_00
MDRRWQPCMPHVNTVRHRYATIRVFDVLNLVLAWPYYSTILYRVCHMTDAGDGDTQRQVARASQRIHGSNSNLAIKSFLLINSCAIHCQSDDSFVTEIMSSTEDDEDNEIAAIFAAEAEGRIAESLSSQEEKPPAASATTAAPAATETASEESAPHRAKRPRLENGETTDAFIELINTESDEPLVVDDNVVDADADDDADVAAAIALSLECSVEPSGQAPRDMAKPAAADDAAAIAALGELGFDEAAARPALRAASGDANLAAIQLFAQMEGGDVRRRCPSFCIPLLSFRDRNQSIDAHALPPRAMLAAAGQRMLDHKSPPLCPSHLHSQVVAATAC